MRPLATNWTQASTVIGNTTRKALDCSISSPTLSQRGKEPPFTLLNGRAMMARKKESIAKNGGSSEVFKEEVAALQALAGQLDESEKGPMRSFLNDTVKRLLAKQRWLLLVRPKNVSLVEQKNVSRKRRRKAY